MAIDPNEVQGFIWSCTNENYLRQLAWTIQDRLLTLGRPGLGLRKAVPVVGNVRQIATSEAADQTEA